MLSSLPDRTFNNSSRTSAFAMPSNSGSQPKDWTNLIKICVGHDEQDFEVHKHILDEIPFFRACLNSPFQESVNKTVQMPEDSAKALAEVVRYAYSGRLSSDLTLTPMDFASKDTALQWPKKMSQLSLALSTYTLARKLGIEDFSNKIIDKIDTFKKKFYATTILELIYIFETPQTEESLRDYLLQYLAWSVQIVGWKVWSEAHESSYLRFFRHNAGNMDTLFGQAMIPKQLVRPSEQRQTEPCKWHIHVSSDNSKCARSKRNKLGNARTRYACKEIDHLDSMLAVLSRECASSCELLVYQATWASSKTTSRDDHR